ncbi:MAG: glycosyltransferase family 4 protein [Verrucomicrobiaceae bacterium]|nr:glycosyltransferase family 4 protein [Verrucomicrobiaceae bacterium]
MRIIHLTPGTGSFYCGSCLRDNALIKALRVRRHDALMVPLYLPLVTDGLAANPEIPVQVGGISLYLAQKMPWIAKMPGFFHRWLNKPERLKKVSQRIGMTSARSLGEMTLGTLQGRDGRQWGEWKKLLAWMRTQPKPDIVSLSNSMLSGLAPAIADEFGCPIVCSLQGEDAFLDGLPEPYGEQCWEALRSNGRAVTRYVAPSQFYAHQMQTRLGASDEQMVVIHNGMDVNAFAAADPSTNFPTIGYFARIIPGKGLNTLVDAFILLCQRRHIQRLKLKIGGSATKSDEAYIKQVKAKLDAAGLKGRYEFHTNLNASDKVRFFRDVTVFSVPCTYGEAFGLYVLEAIASGVPVVQPRHGAFPEILELTKGGLLCEPDSAESLAEGLNQLLLDDVARQRMADEGMNNVRKHFTSSLMAERFEALLVDLKANATAPSVVEVG